MWPEHPERFARLDAAAAMAGESPPDLIRMGAAEFLEQELGKPQQADTTRVVMHSIVMQYLSDAERTRVQRLLERHGGRATRERPLVVVAIEGDKTLLSHAVWARCWPGGGEPRLLAAAHAHGAWYEWRGD